MRTPHLLAVAALVLLFAAPTLSAQALAEKALTTAASPAPTLSLPHVNMPRASLPSSSVHHYSARHTGAQLPPHTTTHRISTRTAHKNSPAAGTPAHTNWRRIQ
jgi:hypothetical protein